jgi:hypothetical protein
MHDEPSFRVGETKIMEARFKKIPVNIVKGFLKVEFESYITFLLH